MAARSSPVRMCVGCRERAVKSDLLRLVVMADDEAAPPTVTAPRRVVPDPTGWRPGRGAFVHPDLSCLDLATRRRAFPKAFRLAGALDASAVRVYLESRQVASQEVQPAKAGRQSDERSMSTKR